MSTITFPLKSLQGLRLIASRVRVDWRSLAAFGLPFIIYLLTLAPTIYNLDSAELTTAAATGGLMRATGYPLYLTLGYFWSKLPIGDVGFRMNLFSAFWAALTILLAERILRRWKVGGWATFGALGLLATATYFWGLSLVAEVYTLHTALMAGLILALLRWNELPTASRVGMVGLLVGLGLTHHAATVLLLPAVFFYLLVSHPRQVFLPRSILGGIAGLLIGLSFYLYLPIRYLSQPAFNYAGTYDAALNFIPINLTTLDGLIWLISGRAFNNLMMAYQGWQIWGELRSFLQQLSQGFFMVGLGPAILGLVALFRREWRSASMTILMFALTAGFYINYRVIDKSTMYLPVYLIWALWLAIGYQELLVFANRIDDHRLRKIGTSILKAGIVGFAFLALIWNWRIVDLSQDRSTRQLGEAILNRAEPGALVFGWWDSMPVIQYLQLVEGKRPDVQAVNRFLITPQDLDQVILEEVENRSIYIDSVPVSLSTRITAKLAGPFYRLELRQDQDQTRDSGIFKPPQPGRY